jgi:endonuclease YncB( thermonuclease family)
MFKTIIILLAMVSLAYAENHCGSIKIVEVMDGDTFRAQIECVQPPLNRISIRVLGIDTPEKRGKCEEEKMLAMKATELLKQKYSEATSVFIIPQGWDKFGGRVLAEVYLDNKSVAEMMIEEGLARPYFGEKKIGWCPANP